MGRVPSERRAGARQEAGHWPARRRPVSVAKMREHVAEADDAYIRALGAKGPKSSATWAEIQDAFVEAIEAKLRGELPDVGPRGGERWPARYAIRRSAWHALDHAWEIEDRAS